MASVEERSEKILRKIREIRHEVDCINKKLSVRSDIERTELDLGLTSQFKVSLKEELDVGRTEESYSCASCYIF